MAGYSERNELLEREVTCLIPGLQHMVLCNACRCNKVCRGADLLQFIAGGYIKWGRTQP